MTHEQEEQLRVLLLEAEVEALRAVLSEFDGDKQEYSQMIKANIIRQLLESVIKQ